MSDKENSVNYKRGKSWINAVKFAEEYPYPLFTLKKDFTNNLKAIKLENKSYNDFLNILQKSGNSTLGHLQNHLNSIYALNDNINSGTMIKIDVKGIIAYQILLYTPIFNAIKPNFESLPLYGELVRAASLVDPQRVLFSKDRFYFDKMLRDMNMDNLDSLKKQRIASFVSQFFSALFESNQDKVMPIVLHEILELKSSTSGSVYSLADASVLRKSLENHSNSFANIKTILSFNPIDDIFNTDFIDIFEKSTHSAKYKMINNTTTGKLGLADYKAILTHNNPMNNKNRSDILQKRKDAAQYIEVEEMKDYLNKYINKSKRKGFHHHVFDSFHLIVAHIRFERYRKEYMEKLFWLKEPSLEEISNNNFPRLRHGYLNYEMLLHANKKMNHNILRYAALRTAVVQFILEDKYMMDNMNKKLLKELLKELQLHKIIAFSNISLTLGESKDETLLSKVISIKDLEEQTANV